MMHTNHLGDSGMKYSPGINIAQGKIPKKNIENKMVYFSICFKKSVVSYLFQFLERNIIIIIENSNSFYQLTRINQFNSVNIRHSLTYRWTWIHGCTQVQVSSRYTLNIYT